MVTRMAGANAFKFVVTLLVVGVIALVSVAIFSAVLSSPAALDLGDPLYEQQRGIVDTVMRLLPLLLPGGLTMAVVFFAVFARSGR